MLCHFAGFATQTSEHDRHAQGGRSKLRGTTLRIHTSPNQMYVRRSSEEEQSIIITTTRTMISRTSHPTHLRICTWEDDSFRGVGTGKKVLFYGGTTSLQNNLSLN